MAHHIFDLFGQRPIASKKRVGFPFFFLHLEAYLSTKVSHNNANIKEDNERFSGPLNGYGTKANIAGMASDDMSLHRAGLLLVLLQGAEDVEGKHHNNPYALLTFGGEQKKTKVSVIFFLKE
jgi:hypothetical protein